MDTGSLAIIAVGSNLGDARGNVLRAIERLRAFTDEPLRKSSLWRTSPVDCPAGSAPFVNAVVGLLPRPTETSDSLFAQLQAIEKEFGRRPKSLLNEARPLDLDLIAFKDERRHGPGLILPHPRAHQRRFVLQPLAEICPELRLPGHSTTITQLLAGLPPDPAMVRLKI